MMKVIVTERGYFGGRLREPGEIMDVPDEKAFSSHWMKKVEEVKVEEVKPTVVADGIIPVEHKRPGRPRARA